MHAVNCAHARPGAWGTVAFATAVCLVCAVLSATVRAESPAIVGSQRDVVFSTYSSLASNRELVRRLLTPLAADSVQYHLAGHALGDQAIDLASEKFTLYVPSSIPPHGYRLLVFVPPWDDAMVPPGWAPILESLGVIFVSPARSGNGRNVMARREPLALLAVQNVVERFPIDPQNIYVGGFSGGSRVALRLAVGYPDVFRGALLNAGSDPLGGAGGVSLPPQELFRQFQVSSRIAYVTGSDDHVNLAMDADSARSMRTWCVAVVAAERTPFRGHQVAAPSALSKALGELIDSAETPAKAIRTCENPIERKLTAELDQAEAMVIRGDRHGARKALLTIDSDYGGLAMPRLTALAERCDCGILKP